MPKEGLTALADSYGLERNELHQLKVLAESFFDKLREDLLGYVGRSLRMTDLSQTTASFTEFATDEVFARHLLFLGCNDQVIAVMRLDNELACALIGGMFGGTGQKPNLERKMTSVEQRVIANTAGAAIVRTAQRVLVPMLHENVNLRLMRIEHRPGLVADTLAPSEQLVTARVRCDTGTQGGFIELGMPFSLIYRIRKSLTPTRTRAADATNGEQKARTLLGEASLELAAVLGRLTLPLRGVRALAPGSVLMLQKTQRGLPRIELRSGDQPLFTGIIIEQDGWYRFLIDRTGGTDERATPDSSPA